MALANVLQADALTRFRRPVRIEYCDASGELSRRVIEPLRIFTSRWGQTYVRAFCRLRGEERTFRLDRIRSWEVLGSGEEERPPAIPAAAVTVPGAATAAPPAAPAGALSRPSAAAYPEPSDAPVARPRRGRGRRRLRRALLWALVTCGLLRFWGRRAWVGSIGPSRPEARHAACLIPVAALPPGMSGFEVAGFRTDEGEVVPDGLYVPVDYDVVGGLTNAVEEGWELREMYVPESIYGRTM